MVAAVLEIFKLEQVILQQQAQFFPPGHTAAQVRNKITRAWFVILLLFTPVTPHGTYFLRHTRQVSPGKTSISIPTLAANAFHSGMHHL